MKNKNMQPWILAGYELFAIDGPKGLKVEVISRKVNKSKSSFYHYFADLEVFTEYLLNYHMERAEIAVQLVNSCKNINPDLINIFIDTKIHLFFNRQLRINRTVEAYKDCFEKSRIVTEAMLSLLAKELGLNDNINIARVVLELASENFYLQITEDNLTKEWLLNYFNEIKLMISGIRRA